MIVRNTEAPIDKRSRFIWLHASLQPFEVFSTPRQKAAFTDFDIKETKYGKLFISRDTHLVDFDGALIPRALLITNNGRTLLQKYPGILQRIDDHIKKMHITQRVVNLVEQTNYSLTMTRRFALNVLTVLKMEEGLMLPDLNKQRRA